MKCKQCQSHLVAYIHRELKPEVRDQVSRHLDECEACYTIYLQYQNNDHRLGQVMPLIGQANRPTLQRVWTSVQADLTQSYPSMKPVSASYGLVALVVTLMLLVPLTMGNRNVPAVLPPTQPAPLVALATPSATEAVESIEELPLLSHTPEARHYYQPEAPVPDAITTPK